MDESIWVACWRMGTGLVERASIKSRGKEPIHRELSADPGQSKIPLCVPANHMAESLIILLDSFDSNDSRAEAEG